MRKNLLVIGVVALIAGFAIGATWQKSKQANLSGTTAGSGETPVPQIHMGSAVLTGQIESVTTGDTGENLTLRLTESVSGHEAAGQADLEAGFCTVERLENYDCAPNNSYLRVTQKTVTLPLSPSVSIQVHSAGPNGEVKLDAQQNALLRDISVSDLQKILKTSNTGRYETPFIITTTHGVITKIQEQFVI